MAVKAGRSFNIKARWEYWSSEGKQLRTLYAQPFKGGPWGEMRGTTMQKTRSGWKPAPARFN